MSRFAEYLRSTRFRTDRELIARTHDYIDLAKETGIPFKQIEDMRLTWCEALRRAPLDVPPDEDVLLIASDAATALLARATRGGTDAVTYESARDIVRDALAKYYKARAQA